MSRTIRRIWSFLYDEHNRGALTLMGAAFGAFCLGAWALFGRVAPDDALRISTQCQADVEKWHGTWNGYSDNIESILTFKSATACDLTLNFSNSADGYHYEGQLVGKLSGPGFTGAIMDREGTSGTFNFTLNEDAKSFSGTYQRSVEPNRKNWTGVRE